MAAFCIGQRITRAPPLADVNYSAPHFARSRNGLVIPPQQELRSVQAELFEVRPRLQLRRAGCQSRCEFEGEEVCPWRNSRHRAVLPVEFAGCAAASSA